MEVRIHHGGGGSRRNAERSAEYYALSQSENGTGPNFKQSDAKSVKAQWLIGPVPCLCCVLAGLAKPRFASDSRTKC